MMKTNVIWVIFFLSALTLNAKSYKVMSPDGTIIVDVNVGANTTYTVSVDGKTILKPSPLSMTFDNGMEIGNNMQVTKVDHFSANGILKPIIRQKSETIADHYNEMTLKTAAYNIHFRVYDDGLAYRFSTNFSKPVKVISENVTYNFADDYTALFPEERSMISAQQPQFYPIKLSEIITDKFCSTPVLIKTDSLARILITESDLESYPGMFLQKQSEHELQGKFAAYVLEEKPTEGRVCYPTKRAAYLAKTEGKRNYPWRAMVIAKNDKDLMLSQLVYKLAPESTGDYSWVKPGKIVWDWWNSNNLYDVNFKAGINTDTYKYYIDFASRYGIEYIVIDDGWSEDWDVTKPIAQMDMEELTAYAEKKNVGIILWVSWVPFEQKMKEAFEQYKKWNIKGLKIDFMNRDDQRMVDFYYTVAKEAAQYKMLIDFHGAYKPTGWSRTFPHVLTSEGVAGLENHKWAEFVTPTHNLILPFSRMVAGPMDYTPGAMQNFHAKDFKIWFDLPASIGTRCHQLGMYVVYESPLQMLADSPSNYYREPVSMEFLSAVPVVWDESRVLEAYVGKQVIVARRKGDTWYIGGMAGEKGASFDITLDFITGERTLTSWEDGINVDRQARDVTKNTKTVKKNDKITIKMYDGGGYAAIIK